MEYVLSLPPAEFLELVAEAAERRREERARQEWLAMRPWMTEKNFVPFDEFYQKAKLQTSAPLVRRSKEELLADAEAIRMAAKRTA